MSGHVEAAAPVVVTPRRRARPRLRRMLRLLLIAGGVALLAAAFALVRPVALGGSLTYIIVSGKSMEPTLSHGDFVAVERQPSYTRGDVIAYRIPADEVGAGRLVIHRIVGGDGVRGFRARGDNRRTQDLWRPRTEDVQGRLRAHVRGTGGVLARIRSPLGLALIAAALCLLLTLPGPAPARSRSAEADADAADR
jgi:signal peptidase I